MNSVSEATIINCSIFDRKKRKNIRKTASINLQLCTLARLRRRVNEFTRAFQDKQGNLTMHLSLQVHVADPVCYKLSMKS